MSRSVVTIGQDVIDHLRTVKGWCLPVIDAQEATDCLIESIRRRFDARCDGSASPASSRERALDGLYDLVLRRFRGFPELGELVAEAEARAVTQPTRQRMAFVLAGAAAQEEPFGEALNEILPRCGPAAVIDLRVAGPSGAVTPSAGATRAGAVDWSWLRTESIRARRGRDKPSSRGRNGRTAG